jgi:hypothetical protein
VILANSTLRRNDDRKPRSSEDLAHGKAQASVSANFDIVAKNDLIYRAAQSANFYIFCSTRRCDADPVALAKYVLALVKKEKPIPQLQASMENSLDVFLQKGAYAH